MPVNAPCEIKLSIEEVKWAKDMAHFTSSKWEGQQGYYNNRLNSHFKGKLGELAVENFLLDQKLKLDSHFRFSDRENLADIVLKVKGYKKVVRLEVKTWSSNYWQDLGRCIAVDQYPNLKKKADIIVWCLVNEKQALDISAPVKVILVGWSKIDEIPKAPIKLTGFEGMRKVENYQLNESNLHEMSEFHKTIR